MGFWSGLLKGAASLVPGVGGVLSNVVGAVTDTAGDAAKGREAGRQSEFQNSVIRNQQDLRQRDFANESQSDAYHKAMLGALGLNVQDASITRPAGVPDTSMRGGLRPSALGMEGRNAAGMLHGQAMQRLHDGEKFDKLADTKGNWIDTALGTAGMIGGALDNYGARKSGDEQNSMIRDILRNAGAQQPSSTAGSAGSASGGSNPWDVTIGGGNPSPAPTPSVSTAWDWQAPDYGILPPDYQHGIGGQGGYGKPSIWGKLFGGG